MTTETSIDVMAELGILDPAEVAQLLKLRHSTVLDLSRRGVLPAFKIGKHWRYRRADLEEWMVRQRDAAYRRRPVLAPAVVDIVGRSPHQATP